MYQKLKRWHTEMKNATQTSVSSVQEKNNFFWKIMRQISHIQETLLVIPCLQTAGVYEFLVETVFFFKNVTGDVFQMTLKLVYLYEKH